MIQAESCTLCASTPYFAISSISFCESRTHPGVRRNSALRPPRRLFVHWHEPARQATRALAGTPAYEHSRRARYRIEALFAELKQRMHLGRVRLRRVWNVAEQVPVGGHRSEPKTVGAIPRTTTTNPESQG
jgi:hypothetical protein